MVRPLGRWWSGVPERFWPTHPEAEAERMRHWVEPWGDRRQELVFIGTGFDRDEIEARLEACLVEDGEFTPERWVDLRDPFPAWDREAA